MIEYLLAPQDGGELDLLLERLARVRGVAPFDELVIDFVGNLSRKVLTDRAFRDHPELMAMAHWFRPASLRDLKAKMNADADGAIIFARRGTVFHIAPSNVDSVFIYSWLLSLLCGNANIARVSRRRSAQMQAFFATTSALMQQPNYSALAENNLVLSYDHDAAITEKLSAHCHLRMVWGGDHTIEQIRAVRLPPLAIEVAFANRFSLAVLKAEAVLALDADGMSQLVHGFYNDAFWFNQQACSSPRALVWIGQGDEGQRARAKFWPALAQLVAARAPENLPAQVMDRVTSLFRLAHEHQDARALTPVGALPSRLWVSELQDYDRLCHDGNGLFLELDRTELAGVASLLKVRDQTIASFGIARSEWLAVLPELPPHAADRIVPVGQALAFSPVWDGVNLLRALTREIQVNVY